MDRCPPRLFERLVAVAAPALYREEILGDLQEGMAREMADGVQSPQRWYGVQAIRSLPHLIILRLQLVDMNRTAEQLALMGVATLLVFGWSHLMVTGQAWRLSVPLIDATQWSGSWVYGAVRLGLHGLGCAFIFTAYRMLHGFRRRPSRPTLAALSGLSAIPPLLSLGSFPLGLAIALSIGHLVMSGLALTVFAIGRGPGRPSTRRRT